MPGQRGSRATRWRSGTTAVHLLACLWATAGCGPQGGDKTADALVLAAQAGLATAAQEQARDAWRKMPPWRDYCTGEYEHQCYWGPVQDDGRAGSELTAEEGRARVLDYINGVRALDGVGPLALDDSLNDFAQEGSEQLARDHRAHGHFDVEGARCGACGENQGDPRGWRAEPISKQIDEILGGMMAEGRGGGHHDNMLDPRWHRLGVGIVNPGQAMYFTTDFAP